MQNPYEAPQADLNKQTSPRGLTFVPDWGTAIVITQLLCLFVPFGLAMLDFKIHHHILIASFGLSFVLTVIGIWWGLRNKRSQYVLGEISLSLTFILLFVGAIMK